MRIITSSFSVFESFESFTPELKLKCRLKTKLLLLFIYEAMTDSFIATPRRLIVHLNFSIPH